MAAEDKTLVKQSHLLFLEILELERRAALFNKKRAEMEMEHAIYTENKLSNYRLDKGADVQQVVSDRVNIQKMFEEESTRLGKEETIARERLKQLRELLQNETFDVTGHRKEMVPSAFKGASDRLSSKLYITGSPEEVLDTLSEAPQKQHEEVLDQLGGDSLGFRKEQLSYQHLHSDFTHHSENIEVSKSLVNLDIQSFGTSHTVDGNSELRYHENLQITEFVNRNKNENEDLESIRTATIEFVEGASNVESEEVTQLAHNILTESDAIGNHQRGESTAIPVEVEDTPDNNLKEISVTVTQKNIITFPLDPMQTLQIVSGPGAGKTATLVYKIAYMINTLKIPPEEILVLSLTNKAVENLKQGLLDVFENQGLVDKICTMTFNGMCHRLVAEQDKQFFEAGIIEDAGWRTIIQLMETKRKMNKFKVQGVIRDLARLGSHPPSDSDCNLDNLVQISKKHQVTKDDVKELKKVLDSMRVLTHSDIMARGKAILEENEVNLTHKVTIVDEFQDMYQDTFDLVRLVSQNTHLVIAGDPNQSIYGFLGTDTTTLLDQLLSLKRLTRFDLKECFRSSPEIVQCANSIMYSDKVCLEKNNPDNFSIKQGPKPIFELFNSTDEQYEFIADEVQRLLDGSDGAIRPSDIAILTRTNAQVKKISKLLNFSGIRTNKLSSSPSWLSNELFHMIDYLRIIFSPEEANFSVLCTLELLPNVGPTTIKKLYAETNRSDIPLLEILAKNPPTGTIASYVKEISEARKGMDFDDPNDIFQRLLSLGHKLGLSTRVAKSVKDENDKNVILQQLVDLKENLKLINYMRPDEITLLEFFLENYANVLPISSMDDSIKISTIHSAKGLEFPIVFLPELKPHGSRSTWDPNAGFTLTDEEKRLTYVGITRAKTLLYMQMNRMDVNPRLKRPEVFSTHLVSTGPPNLNSSLLNTFRNNRVKHFNGHGLPFSLSKNFYRPLHTMRRLCV